MAINALQSSATALSALNTALDVTAHNLANVNTDGFKGSRVNFQDLLYIDKAQPGTLNAIGDSRPTGLQIGLGVKVSGTQLDFEQGPPKNTGRMLDVMIDGDGFFRVQVDPAQGGGVAYTRAGNLVVNKNGELVMANDQGRRLLPITTTPENAEKIQIGSDGRVFVSVPNSIEVEERGQLELSTFINPAGLKQIGENLYVETDATGQPNNAAPGEGNHGRIKQGFLEGSNIDPTRELIEMIRTQRAFEMNSNSIRAADETLRNVAALRR